MAQMTYIEKDYFERLFDMETGYVLDFTNYTYQRFVADTINIDVYKKYHNVSSGRITQKRDEFNKKLGIPKRKER